MRTVATFCERQRALRDQRRADPFRRRMRFDPYIPRGGRFLLPVPTRSRIFGPLCQRRLEAGMRHAAGTGQIFHLWWHPHNFGSHVDDNIALLRTIMERYRALSEMQGMTSRTMGEIAAAARPGVARQLESAAQRVEAPLAPRPEVVEAAQVSATAP